MWPLKDTVVRMINMPTQYAQNPGSLEDQFEYLIEVIDTSWVLNFSEWKVSKGIASNQKLSGTYTTMAEMSAALREFYYVYLPLVNFP